MKKFLHRNDWPWVILLTAIVLLPNFYLAVVGSDLSGRWMAKIAYLIFSLILFSIPALFLKGKAFFLFEGIFVLLAPLEIGHIYLNKMGVTIGYMMALLATDWHESIELLSSIKVLLLTVVVVWIAYFWITIRKIENKYFIPKLKWRMATISAFLVIFIALFAYQYRLASIIVPKSQKSRVLPMSWDTFTLKFIKTYPCNLIFKTCNALQIHHEIKSGQKELTDFIFHAQKNQSLEEKEIYLFILGETARYSQFSINAYARNTSPLLSSLDNLVSYSDMYSQANLTEIALPFIFTRGTALDENRFPKEKSFVDAFQEAGFSTYWIANQSAGNSFVRRISHDATGEYFMVKDYDAIDNFDEKLWPYLDEILTKNEEKVLIVLHTLGSHFRYNFRYPNEYNVFKPSFCGAFEYDQSTADNKELFINTYDNSILYTDYFLYHTIKKIEEQNAVSFVIYTSDHGENLFDTDEKISLHGGIHPTQFDVHLPFFVWTSEKYREQYPEKWMNTQNNKDKKLNSSVIFHSMLDAADISFPEQNLRRSIVSDSLRADSARYVRTPDFQTVRID